MSIQFKDCLETAEIVDLEDLDDLENMDEKNIIYGKKNQICIEFCKKKFGYIAMGLFTIMLIIFIIYLVVTNQQ